jgi:hypothetical protein
MLGKILAKKMYLLTFFRCFAHIVNLACKAMVTRTTLRGGNYDPVQKLRDAISHVSLLLSFFPDL